MRRLVPVILLAVTLAAWAAPVGAAQDLTPEQIRATARFDPHMGQSIPLDLAFLDETGQPVTLGTYFTSNRPVIFTLNYFHCQNLCFLELQGLVNGLNGIPFTLGNQYTAVTVSFDARETPEDAMGAKVRALRGYVHPEAAGGWHLLTTDDQATIDRLTDAVGFHYAYDAQEDDYAHPVGVVVLTPAGEISRYIYGLDFSANDLRLALVDAAARHIGTIVDQVLLICYHYEPITGRYTPMVMDMLRVAGGVTVLLVAALVVFLTRVGPHRPSGTSEALG